MQKSLWEQNSTILSTPNTSNNGALDISNFFNTDKGYTVPDYGGLDLNFGKIADTAGKVNDTGDKWTFFQKLFGGKNIEGEKIGGAAAPILGGISSGLQAYLGFKQLGLAEDQLDFAKSSFSKNFEAQRGSTNRRLEDRQNARLAANPTGYLSTEDYMKKYGV